MGYFQFDCKDIPYTSTFGSKGFSRSKYAIQSCRNIYLMGNLEIQGVLYTGNVLPIETTDFVCVQNPVVDHLYFLTNSITDFI